MPQYSYKNKINGLTMIEVLVTMSIMSIGLLGMAGLQLNGVRSINSSSFRTQASILANDIAERMRANPMAVDNNQFMNINSNAIDCSAVPATYCSEQYTQAGAVLVAESCNTTQMAAYDINVWYCGVQSAGSRHSGVTDQLAEASMTIRCIDTNPTGGDADPCTNRSPHVISLSWAEQNPNSGTAGEAVITQTISLTVQP